MKQQNIENKIKACEEHKQFLKEAFFRDGRKDEDEDMTKLEKIRFNIDERQFGAQLDIVKARNTAARYSSPSCVSLSSDLQYKVPEMAQSHTERYLLQNQQQELERTSNCLSSERFKQTTVQLIDKVEELKSKKNPKLGHVARDKAGVPRPEPEHEYWKRQQRINQIQMAEEKKSIFVKPSEIQVASKPLSVVPAARETQTSKMQNFDHMITELRVPQLQGPRSNLDHYQARSSKVGAQQRTTEQARKAQRGGENCAGGNSRGDPFLHRIDLQQTHRKLIISLSMFIPVHLAPLQHLVYPYPAHLVGLHHPQHCVLQVSTVIQTSKGQLLLLSIEGLVVCQGERSCL